MKYRAILSILLIIVGFTLWFISGDSITAVIKGSTFVLIGVYFMNNLKKDE